MTDEEIALSLCEYCADERKVDGKALCSNCYYELTHCRSCGEQISFDDTFCGRCADNDDVVMTYEEALNLDTRDFDPLHASLAQALEMVEALEDTLCVVCQEDVLTGQFARQTPCGHLFHESCIQDALGHNTDCPCCRADVRNMLP